MATVGVLQLTKSLPLHLGNEGVHLTITAPFRLYGNFSLFFSEHYPANFASNLANRLDGINVLDLLVDNQEGGEQVAQWDNQVHEGN